MIINLTNSITKNKIAKLTLSITILLLIILIGVFVYITGGTTSYVHLMYIPILTAVFLFGIKEGVIASIIAGLVLGPYMPMVVKDGIMQETRSWAFRIVMFIIITLVVGLLLKYVKSLNEAEKKRALTDISTGFPNYNKFIEDIEQLIFEKKHNTISILVLEYRNKKMIDRYVDYNTGKKSYINLLNEASTFFVSCNIYIIGSNKFLIVIPDEDFLKVQEMAKEFTEIIKQPMFINSLPISIVVKGGIINFPMHEETINEIILKLEKVLSQAEKKQQSIITYDNNLEIERIKYYNTLVSMYYSLQNDAFELVYQPKIDITNQDLIGTEALLRLKQDGFISISQLISMAEDVGFIKEITKWVISNSIIQIKSWQELGVDIKVSINLSSIDLNDESIINHTKKCLISNGVHPSMIEFELTERTIIQDKNTVLSVLEKIKKEGIKLSLDDYGSGYNSLSYLVNNSFPFDYLKIDKNFIDNIEKEHNEVLIRGIIETAHVLGIKVVAEGVETEEQFNILKRTGCDIVQGYYFSKPLKPDELIEYKKFTLNT